MFGVTPHCTQAVFTQSNYKMYKLGKETNLERMLLNIHCCWIFMWITKIFFKNIYKTCKI